jgi:hypothetical protein
VSIVNFKSIAPVSRLRQRVLARFAKALSAALTERASAREKPHDGAGQMFNRHIRNA